MSRRREHHVLHTTTCRECGAKPGQRCKIEATAFQAARLKLHPIRREDWIAAGRPKVDLDLGQK